MPGKGRYRAVLMDFGSAREAPVDVHSRAEALAVQEDAEAHCRRACKSCSCRAVIAKGAEAAAQQLAMVRNVYTFLVSCTAGQPMLLLLSIAPVHRTCQPHCDGKAQT